MFVCMNSVMIIAVSDLHLGDPLSNKLGFKQFIDEFLKPKSDEITHLVLLGDVFDFWRRDSSTVLLDNLDILNSISSLGFHVIYVVGNHDFNMIEYGMGKQEQDVRNLAPDNSSNITVCKEYQITNGGKNFRFIHGHQINYWYALPFYETFSRAMCDTDKQISERADVWSLIDRLQDISPILQQKILQLSRKTRAQIENKLAGPLEGFSMSAEESAIAEPNLLSSLTQIDQYSDDNKNELLFYGISKSIQELIDSSNRALQIESLSNLLEQIEDSTHKEVEQKFLVTWKDIFQWILSKTGKEWFLEKQQLTQYARRIAAMFTTELKHNEFLIHGHGHSTFVNQETRTADAGCWIREEASFLMLEDGEVTSNSWPML